MLYDNLDSREELDLDLDPGTATDDLSFWKDNEDVDGDEYKNETMPTFVWDENHLSFDDAWLVIEFKDQGPNDVAILTSYNPIPDAPDDKDQDEIDDCIFKGHLQTDSEVPVSLNGCPGSSTFTVRFCTKL